MYKKKKKKKTGRGKRRGGNGRKGDQKSDCLMKNCDCIWVCILYSTSTYLKFYSISSFVQILINYSKTLSFFCSFSSMPPYAGRFVQTCHPSFFPVAVSIFSMFFPLPSFIHSSIHSYIHADIPMAVGGRAPSFLCSYLKKIDLKKENKKKWGKKANKTPPILSSRLSSAEKNPYRVERRRASKYNCRVRSSSIGAQPENPAFEIQLQFPFFKFQTINQYR